MILPRRNLALTLASLTLAACAGSASTASSGPSPGPMPPNAAWRGMYQGPYHIALNIWTQGNQASGNWRAVGDREGTFSGTTFGNLLILNFTEHAVNSAERYSGRGYFVYSVGKPGEPHHIYGEWGMGRSGRSDPWWAVKRAEEPLGNETQPLIDKDADEQYRDDAPGCDMGNCDTQDNDTQ